MNQELALGTCIARPGAVAIEVSDARGRWWSGFWLLEFHPDGFISALSAATGVVRKLPQDQWRDPAEEAMKQAFARDPHTLELVEV